LPAGARRPAHRLGYLGERDGEDIVQDETDALGWGELLQRDQERE
jgi:hypothetical protein